LTHDISEEPGSEVDANLRRVFERTLSEDLPARFKDLIDRLRTNEQAGTAPDTAPEE